MLSPQRGHFTFLVRPVSYWVSSHVHKALSQSLRLELLHQLSNILSSSTCCGCCLQRRPFSCSPWLLSCDVRAASGPSTSSQPQLSSPCVLTSLELGPWTEATGIGVAAVCPVYSQQGPRAHHVLGFSLRLCKHRSQTSCCGAFSLNSSIFIFLATFLFD